MTYIPKAHVIRPIDVTSRMQRIMADILQRAGEGVVSDKPITYSQGVVTFHRFTYGKDGRLALDGEWQPVTEEASIRIKSHGDRAWLEALCHVLEGPRPDVYRGESARLSAEVQRGTQPPTPEDQ